MGGFRGQAWAAAPCPAPKVWAGGTSQAKGSVLDAGAEQPLVNPMEQHPGPASSSGLRVLLSATTSALKWFLELPSVA